ncbi:MAG: hypothetical protein ACTSWV_03245 [Candidatus Asgardarchaeia archaeon]
MMPNILELREADLEDFEKLIDIFYSYIKENRGSEDLYELLEEIYSSDTIKLVYLGSEAIGFITSEYLNEETALISNFYVIDEQRSYELQCLLMENYMDELREKGVRLAILKGTPFIEDLIVKLGFRPLGGDFYAKSISPIVCG